MLKTLFILKEKKLRNSECKKIESMLSDYIEHKLTLEERIYVENHFAQCPDCYQKYLEMKAIIGNLHFEYARLIKEFDKLEKEKILNIKDYDNFYQNISPYIDDELCYDDSIKFRKYLLKSKPAREKLANAYILKNNIKDSVINYQDRLNINFTKKLMKKIRKNQTDDFYKKYINAIIFIGFIISAMVLLTVYLGFHYISEYFDRGTNNFKLVQKIDIPNEDEMIEFTFDLGKIPLLTAK